MPARWFPDATQNRIVNDKHDEYIQSNRRFGGKLRKKNSQFGSREKSRKCKADRNQRVTKDCKITDDISEAISRDVELKNDTKQCDHS